jgi:hypothetical protein
MDADWWRGYDNACYYAALNQGLAPLALRLAAAKIPFRVEQTGGFCMTIGSYLTKDQSRYIWVTNVQEGIEPGTTVDDLRWYACQYHDVNADRNWRELTASGTCNEVATLIATELKGWGVDCSPDVEGSDELYRDAYAQGLAPMALRLALKGMPFTVERPDSDATVLQVPLTSSTHLWVTAEENADCVDPKGLRWRINLGSPVTTDEAIAILTYERGKVDADA